MEFSGDDNSHTRHQVICPPPRPNIVRRPRLIERLNGGLHRKLTLISAPAGFGKTTLVSAWLATCQRPAVWLSLDDGDHDPIRFLTHLVAALRTIAPGTGEGVLAVLDAQPVDRALSFLLEHAPPQLHLVMATREDPQLPLSRLRARDQLTELRVADLCFTERGQKAPGL